MSADEPTAPPTRPTRERFQVDALRQLMEAASMRNWSVRSASSWEVTAPGLGQRSDVVASFPYKGDERAVSDARLVAAMRNVLPDLLDEIERLSALLAGEGTAQPASPPWAGDDVTGSTLLLGVWFPNCPPDTDPEIVADCVAVILNEERDRNGGTEGAVEIAGIPAPQWLTPETLANLKRAASGEGTAPPPAKQWSFDSEFVGGPQPTDYGTGTEWDGGYQWAIFDGPVELTDVVLTGVADEDPDAVLAEICAAHNRGTAPQVPTDVLWEGQTEPMVTDATPAHSNLYRLPFTPGTYVRVVAADGAPTET